MPSSASSSSSRNSNGGSVEREIAVLRDLVRAACRSADTCAAAAERAGAADPHRAALLERLREDRRLLLVDLVRCLLLRGLPVPEVRAAMTEVLAPADPGADPDHLRADLEIAEGRLELALRRALADATSGAPGVSQPTVELLSLHYLRLQLRRREAEAAPPAAARPAAAAPLAAAVAAAAVPSPRAGAHLLH